jgi:hypothetical protein
MPCLTIRSGSGIVCASNATLDVKVTQSLWASYGSLQQRPFGGGGALLFQPMGKGAFFSPMLRSRRPSKVCGSLAALLKPMPDEVQKFIYRQSRGLRFVCVEVTKSFRPRSALGVLSSVPVVLELPSHSLIIFDRQKGVFSRFEPLNARCSTFSGRQQ